jgi:hypothetical protein
MSLLNTASLIVTPNGYKEGTLYSVIPTNGAGDMSVVRATTATRVNSSGLVELVPYNLSTYSEQFNNVDWIKADATITANAIVAPNGTTTADKITEISSTAFFIAGNLATLNASTAHTFSFYAKSAERSIARVLLGNSNFNQNYAYFNLSTGVTTTNATSSSMVDVGNGWYRCIVTDTTLSSTTNGVAGWIGPSNNMINAYNTYSGTAGNGIYIWGAQLVEGTLPKDYQRTETRLNIPRLDYSNGTCPSLLVEPQRTNLALYSSQFDNVLWNKTLNGTGSLPVATANATISPSGIQDADLLVFNSGSGTTAGDESQMSQVFVSVAGQKYTASFYAKGVTGGEQILVRHCGASSYTKFTLTNQWVRYTLTETAFLTGAINFTFSLRRDIDEPLNSTASFYLWGAQMEQGSYATSYIPTTSASVTRNADVVSKTGISSLIGQTEGTMFVDAYITGKDTSNGSILFATDKVSSGAIMRILYTPTNALRFDVFDGSSFQCQISAGAYNVGDRLKIAGGYKANDFVMYVNGTQIGVDTSGSVPATDKANINTSIYGDTNGSRVNSAILWTTRLTNTQLAQLTTI